jgi:glycosyltransferase involved in cell wall biosynthesis
MGCPLTVVILAKNEEARIEQCLKSVYGWAEEIILIDDESQDGTAVIASKYTEKIFKRRMDLEGKQRNFGISLAKFDWVIMVDSDEVLTSELKQEIEEVVSHKEDDHIAAYSISKVHYLGQHQLKYGGWSRPSIKLGNRKYVRCSEAAHDLIHVGIIIERGYKTGVLKNPYIHYSSSSIEDFIRKDNRYSTLEAMKWHISGRKMGLGRALWRTLDRFVRRFISKQGYKDGFYGFIAAFMSGSHELLTYAKYREIKEHKTYRISKDL